MAMRVLLADDHALFREGLTSLLASRGIEVIGQASDGVEAVTLTRVLRPDVVLMDLSMPGMGGSEATRLIAEEAPDVAVVILTVSETDQDLFEAIRSGARGYLVKSTSADEFFDLLGALHRGEVPLSRGLATKIVRYIVEGGAGNDLPDLTPREREILVLVADGATNREVARRLRVSEPTVKFHMTHILRKLHLQNRAQAVAYAHRHGLTQEDA